MFEDACHVFWGDCCGVVWGQRHETIAVPMSNTRQRQTYYGALNMVTKAFHMHPCDKGNGQNTVASIASLQTFYPGKQRWLLWDNAASHRYGAMQKFLATVNRGVPEAQWKITCIPFATDAPEQNPVEDIWLKGKNLLRKNFTRHKTFENVKQCFVQCVSALHFDSCKLGWYYPQII